MPNLEPMQPGGIPQGETPLESLLQGQVERVLESWRRVSPGAEPPAGAIDGFMAALRALEAATEGLSSREEPVASARAAPGWTELDAARSYAHLAGILPRALERALAFDAAAAALRHPDGEWLVDAVSRGDPALEEAVKVRAMQLARLLSGGTDDDGEGLPARPAILRSSLFMPLAAGGLMVGVTYVAAVRPDAFSEADQRLLADLASHASGAFRRLQGHGGRIRATARQAQVLSLIAAGLSDKEVAERLRISHRTVRTHLERVLKEQGLRSRAAAVTAWLRGEQD